MGKQAVYGYPCVSDPNDFIPDGECWNDDVQRENYTKKTGLWIGDGFVLPAMNAAPAPHRHDIHLMTPSEDRGDKRSVTPSGFAQAVFAANAPAAQTAVEVA